jgi:hypothetical protein
VETTLDLIFALITVFTIGMGVGAFLEDKKLETVFNPALKKYMAQKTQMWNKFKKMIKV